MTPPTNAPSGRPGRPDIEAITFRVEQARKKSPESLIVRDFTVLLAYIAWLEGEA